jgi:hypothetical protein
MGIFWPSDFRTLLVDHIMMSMSKFHACNWFFEVSKIGTLSFDHHELSL